MQATLEKIGAGWFSGPLEGFDGPKLDIFINKNTTFGVYISAWEIEKHIDGSRSHILYASGKLHPTDDGYSGEIVSVRHHKVRGWRAVARKGSATVSFEAL